jgi:hypothetical protein
MPTVIGRTKGGRDIVRHAPEEGCAWRCATCGDFLRGRFEVRGHWALHSRGHSVFVRRRTGRVYHQTIEGLHERDWVLPATSEEEST